MSDRGKTTVIPILRAEITDVGATQEVAIYAGDAFLLRYLPGSRYVTSAIDSVNELVVATFRPLFEEAFQSSSSIGHSLALEPRDPDDYY